MTSEQIDAEFLGAVFRLEVETGASPTTGTGYLIDREKGYVLTAFHVVEKASEAPGVKITATSPRLPGRTLHLSYLGKSRIDLALLRVDDPSLIATIRPLDVALSFPPRGRRVFTVGYTGGKLTPDVGAPDLLGKYDKEGSGPDCAGCYGVQQDVDPGSSGSPLIDVTGAVIATCVDYVYRNKALYQPLFDAQDLLDAIPPDQRVADLDEHVRHDRGIVQLIEMLRWRTGNPSNLTLYQWATLIGKSAADYSSRSQYLACPIMPAYSGRGLGDKALTSIARLTPPSIHAEALLMSAEQADNLQRPSQVIALAKEAAALGDTPVRARAVAKAEAAEWGVAKERWRVGALAFTSRAGGEFSSGSASNWRPPRCSSPT